MSSTDAGPVLSLDKRLRILFQDFRDRMLMGNKRIDDSYAPTDKEEKE